MKVPSKSGQKCPSLAELFVARSHPGIPRIIPGMWEKHGKKTWKKNGKNWGN